MRFIKRLINLILTLIVVLVIIVLDWKIDLKQVDLGEYTFVFEMYYDENKVNKDLVVVEAHSVPLNISKNTTKTFNNHSRTIINFNKPGNIGIIDFDIDITIKYRTSYAYVYLFSDWPKAYGEFSKSAPVTS